MWCIKIKSKVDKLDFNIFQIISWQHPQCPQQEWSLIAFGNKWFFLHFRMKIFLALLHCTHSHTTGFRGWINVSLQQWGAIVAWRRCCHSDVHLTVLLPGRRLHHLFSFLLCGDEWSGGMGVGSRGGTVSAYPGKITWLLSECVRVCGEW